MQPVEDGSDHKGIHPEKCIKIEEYRACRVVEEIRGSYYTDAGGHGGEDDRCLARAGVAQKEKCGRPDEIELFFNGQGPEMQEVGQDRQAIIYKGPVFGK